MRTVFLLVVFLYLGLAASQERYRLCASDTISDNTCTSLQRGDSLVSCIRVEDSADCAILLNRGTADFGVFSAEEALLARKFYPSDTLIVAQLKHRDRTAESFEFQSVVVVPHNFSAGSFDSLRQGGLCHPGFSQSQIWNDHVLKYFENKVYNKTCNAELTAAENEAENLKNYFGNACRPGSWVADAGKDRLLKQKYPELCAACDNTTSCSYNRTENHGHIGALDCLVGGKGGAAYVALAYVYQYFGIDSTILSADVTTFTLDQRFLNYRFLCPDGILEPLYTATPCAWVKQPWSAIVARSAQASALQTALTGWLNADEALTSAQPWIGTLNTILQRDTIADFQTDLPSLTTFLARGRDLNFTAVSCGNDVRWCTIGSVENNKCSWIAEAGLTHGIEPRITCNQANTTFQCFHDIVDNKADIVTIDSNYGHIARQVFNLSTVFYAETDNDRNSVVVAVVREGASYNVSSFAALSGRTACFPEIGGIAWLSFLNAARSNNVISDSCDVVTEISNLLSGACTPGLGDLDHLNGTISSTASKLCSLCPIESNNASCSANSSNIYYGDKGALECLNSGAGDVAFIEVKNLNDYVNSGVIDPSKYRVLCKNSSLASYTGFVVDEQCALSVTIDSEMVSRRGNSALNITDTTLALLKIEDWLGYRGDIVRPIYVYGPFNGTKDLLFKDSTTGLETTSSTLRAVLAYKELFAHTESCSGAGTVIASLSTVLVVFLARYL